MTRFLPRTFAGLAGSGFSKETSRLFAYHQVTKHSYGSVRANARLLDWHNQPDPFRINKGAPLTALPPEPGFPDTGTFAAMAGLERPERILQEINSGGRAPVLLDVTWLSRLLWHSMAISARKKISPAGIHYSLRVNPSSGNLHPTETHLALDGFAGVASGLYHYRVDRHAVELRSRGTWTRRLARALEIPWAEGSPLIIGLTSIFWREAWKYGNRAYRYCCHDLGHAMMSILLAAQALGLPGDVVTHFSDVRLARELGLAESDEAPMAFLVFLPEGRSNEPSIRPVQPIGGVPNELSPEEIPYEELLRMHRSTILPEPAGALPRIFPAAAGGARDQASRPTASRDAPLGVTVRRRRSALDFDPRTSPMERSEVEQLLDFATRDWPADWRRNFGGTAMPSGNGADCVALYLYLHRVHDCEPGVYFWNQSSRKLQPLHRGNVERVAAYLSLEQSLAGNACFAVSMVADLAAAGRVFGNRGYRYVHFEAGAIGQRLYVGAEALGWNATGIGAFYDDDVHRYLGFLEEGEGSVGTSLREAEQAPLVMMGSPASRAAWDQQQNEPVPMISESGEESLSGSRRGQENRAELLARKDPRNLPRQVIYHFAVGRAVPDPRLEA
jgi:SagB-type dehydrogenase family enzyme